MTLGCLFAIFFVSRIFLDLLFVRHFGSKHQLAQWDLHSFQGIPLQGILSQATSQARPFFVECELKDLPPTSVCGPAVFSLSL